MIPNIFQWRSLKTRVTLFTLAIFLVGIWSLAFYASRMLREDLQRQLGEQQLSAASYLAAEVNEQLEARVKALEAVAGGIAPALLQSPERLQAYLDQRLVIRLMFNAGAYVTGPDGTALASVPLGVERIGVNYMDRDHIASALRDGRSRIGEVAVGKVLRAPSVAIAVPVRDQSGKPIGALAAVIDLGQPNFLDKISGNRYGATGGYLLIAPRQRLIVTASDRSRIMERLPPPGQHPALDRFIDGYEGSAVLVNPRGVEILASDKGVPLPGWIMAAVLPTAEAFAPIRALQQRILLATIVLTLLAGGLIWWMIRRQLSPMLHAAKAMAALTESGQPLQALPVVRQDEIGELIGGFNRLLSDLSQREEALRESEARYRRAVDGANDGVWEWNPATGEDYLSPRWKQLLGYEDHELPNRQASFFDAVHPEDRLRLEREIQVHFAENTPFGIEFRLRHRDGAYRWFFSRGQATRDAQGLPLLMSGSITDVTERKRIEAALVESESRFRAIFEQVPMISVQGYDKSRRVIFWNRASEVLYGYTSEQALGRQLEDLIIPPPMRDTVVRLVADWVNGGAAIPASELTLLHANGGPVEVFSSHVMLHDATGEPEMYCIDIDIAARKQAERQLLEHQTDLEEKIRQRTNDLAQARDAAEAANRAKSAFLANMSHEIRTPMTAIIGMGDLMKLEPMTPRQLERLGKMNVAARHLLEIISDVLDLSKIEAGKVVLENTEVRVGELLSHVATMMADRAQARGLRIEVSLAPIPGRLRGDPTRIQQALLNYVGNAIKFSERSPITLRARVDEDLGEQVRLRFEVQDHGIGIAADTVSRLFHSFEQADNSMTRRYGGTGLGLAIVKQLAQLMGGDAGVNSEEGVGSTFWFTVCLDKSSAPEAATAGADSADAVATEPLNNRHRVLIVDDERTNREVIDAMLETIGLCTEAAANGDEAVQSVARTRYDLILMDIHMPKMDGIEATRQIRSLPTGADVPILALTGDAVSEVRDECEAAGMDGFITKPFRMEQLLDGVKRWLR